MARRKKRKLQTFESGIERRMVENPLRTRATYLEELQEKPITEQPGKIEVSVNMATLIGGFARVKNRTEAQILAAAKFRGLYERSMLGGPKSLDYSAVKVDVSGPSENAIFEIGEQARREYMGAVQRLGIIQSNLVECLVVHDMSVRDLARQTGEGEGGAARERMTVAVRSAVDVLAEHFGYAGESHGRAKPRVWDDASATLFSGTISTRRKHKRAA